MVGALPSCPPLATALGSMGEVAIEAIQAEAYPDVLKI